MGYSTREMILVAFLAGTLILAGGCAKKTGVQLSEKTTSSMHDVEADMKRASGQIDATNTALNAVVSTGQTAAEPEDIKKAFNTYSDSVKKMDQVAASLNKRIDQMNTRGNDYFEEWSKAGGTYTNPQVQKLSAQERARLSQSFLEITSSSAGMRGTLNAYVSEIKQIQTYLSNDLTSRGISAIAPVAQAAQRDGNNLKRLFQPVQTAIERARIEMTPGAAAGGTSGAGAASGASGVTSGTTGTAGGTGGVQQNQQLYLQPKQQSTQQPYLQPSQPNQR